MGIDKHLGIVFLLSSVWISMKYGARAGDMEPPAEIDCREGMANVLRRQIQGVQVCTQKMGIKDAAERTAKYACIQKCVYVDSGLLQPDGKPAQEYLDSYLKTKFALNLYPRAKLLSQACFDQHNGIMDTAEASCASFIPFNKCITESITKAS